MGNKKDGVEFEFLIRTFLWQNKATLASNRQKKHFCLYIRLLLDGKSSVPGKI